jgi:hypothetical protein
MCSPTSQAPPGMSMAMLRERHMGQLRANASVPPPVLVVLSIRRGGCSAVGYASSGIYSVYIPIYTPLLSFHPCWHVKAWNHPHTMTITIFYVLSQESDQCWKSCTGWGRWRARLFAIVACQIVSVVCLANAYWNMISLEVVAKESWCQSYFPMLLRYQT